MATQTATLMPWQGKEDMMISRHDVRVHMDIITSYQGEHDDAYETTEEQDVRVVDLRRTLASPTRGHV